MDIACSGTKEYGSTCVRGCIYKRDGKKINVPLVQHM